jgi:hypothetical protein
MSDALRMVAALRSALFTRLDVLFEILALRHQLGVLARADRRFRLADRLLWLCLQRYWPRWRDALVLLQPATVARWRREGFWGCWRSLRRRPGRPRIDADIRVLIRRMTRENRLWGAPRIHGELLKLGITVSERTVSRYLPDRARRPSQTWRTFLVNHFSDLTFTSSLASSEAQGDDDVVDACVRPSRSTPTSGDLPRAGDQWAVVDWSPSVPHTCLGWRDARADRYHRASTRPISGRGRQGLELARLALTHMGGGSFARILQYAAGQRTV